MGTIYTDSSVCVRHVTDEGFFGFKVKDLLELANDEENFIIGWLDTSYLFNDSIALIQKLWKQEINEHFDRIKETSLNYPIIMYNGEIVEGLHRVVKAYLSGQGQVKVKHLKDLPEIKKL